METSRTHLSGIFAMLLSAAIWGFAFVAQRASMDFVGPFTFSGLRFALGSLVLIPWALAARNAPKAPRVTSQPRHQWLGIGLAGLVLFVSINLQQFGLIYTTAGKAGFITGLYVVLVPLLGLLRRHRVGAPVWAGCILAAAGLYLLSIVGGFTIAAGDALVLASAFGWAVHVHIVGWLAQRVHPIRVAILQFAICAALSLIVAVFRESIEISSLFEAKWMILYAGVLSVGVAYTLQVVAQRHVAPAEASIVLSLESVFAVLGGWLLLGEVLSPRGMVGCGLMLAGMILAQVRFQRKAGSPGISSSGT